MTTKLTALAATTTAVVAVASFSISAVATTEVAAMAGMPMPFLMPVVLDGLILAGSISAVQMRTRRSRAQRLWPICVVVAGTVASIGANVVHATATALGQIECALIAGTVPLALMMTAHLLITGATPEPAAKAARVAAPARARAAAVAPAAKAVEPAAAVEAQILAYRDEHDGTWPTGAHVASEWLGGKSSKTGSRAVAAVRLAHTS